MNAFPALRSAACHTMVMLCMLLPLSACNGGSGSSSATDDAGAELGETAGQQLPGKHLLPAGYRQVELHISDDRQRSSAFKLALTCTSPAAGGAAAVNGLVKATLDAPGLCEACAFSGTWEQLYPGNFSIGNSGSSGGDSPAQLTFLAHEQGVQGGASLATLSLDSFSFVCNGQGGGAPNRQTTPLEGVVSAGQLKLVCEGTELLSINLNGAAVQLIYSR